MLGGQQLGDRTLGTWRPADDRAHDVAQVEGLHRMLFSADLADLDERRRVAGAMDGDQIDEFTGREQIQGTLVTPDRHPFVAERRPGDGPSVVDLADHVVIGDEYVGEEHLVEERLASDLAQRANLHPLGLHVDRERRDTSVLGSLEVGAHGGEAAVAVERATGPHLLPVHEPATVDPGCPGGDRSGVRAGAGLAEQLAPSLLLAKARQDPPVDLIGRRVLDEREQHPRTDAETGTFEVGQLLVDHQLFERTRTTAERLGPMRHAIARLDQRSPPLVGAQRVVAGAELASLGPEVFGRWRQFDAGVGLDAGCEQRRRFQGGGVVGAGDRSEHRRTTQVQMCVVLPGEADTAEDLDVLLGAAPVCRHRLRGCQVGGERGGVADRTGAPCVPCAGGREFGVDEHVGTVMLDRLEVRDRASELLA